MPKVAQPKAKVAGAAKKARSKLYSMPEKVPEGTILTDLSKAQWRIGPSIGIGGFGEIYSACSVGDEKNYNYVIKCEPHANGPLFVEMHFYMRNARQDDIERYKKERGLKSLGMPYMIGNGSAEVNGQKHRFIVMPRYGRDVASLMSSNGGRLPEGTAYRLALQILDVYEFLHFRGYIHADLKGANILMGQGKGANAQAYLVDYGLASHITTKEFKPDPKKMHNGTIEYTSRDAHQGVATMRADLEILGYNLIEWLGGQLPWVKDNLLATPVKVQKAKEEFMADVGGNLKRIFPKGVSAPLAEYMKYVAKLAYNDKPDYDKCRKIFTNGLKALNMTNAGDLIFDHKLIQEARGKKRSAAAAADAIDSEDEDICASADDDGDVVFDKKKPIRAAPGSAKKMKLKTIPNGKSPATKKSPASARKPHKVSPTLPSPRRPLHTAQNMRTEAAAKTPPSAKRTSPRENKKTTGTPQPGGATTRATPLSTKANIKFSPAVSVATSSVGSRPGKTIVNDQLTPNPRATKTYEFNFELDVSMDANVVVNVKRKRKPAKDGTTTTESSDAPATRVNIRKKQGGPSEDSGSPRTPVVTVKKTKRFA